MQKTGQIKIKSEAELDILRRAGNILAVIVQELLSSLKEGMTTQDIDQQAEKLMAGHNVKPAFKGYRGFPGCVCVSLNDEVVHGIPSSKVIKRGDIISLDVGIIYQDYFSDMAVSVGVG